MALPSNALPNGVWGMGSPADIDAKSSGSTVISNTNDSEFHPFSISIEVVEASGVTVPGTISIGTNSPNYNNIVSLATLDNILSIKNILADSAKVPNSTDIKVKSVTQSVATSHKFRIAMWGHLGFPT